MREAAAGPDGRLRCPWSLGSAEYLSYHDAEWGRPVRDDIGVFERICLEGFQSGLSWLIILRKRENSGPRSRASIRSPWPNSARQTSPGCWPILGSCAIARRSRQPLTMPAPRSACPPGWRRPCGATRPVRTVLLARTSRRRPWTTFRHGRRPARRCQPSSGGPDSDLPDRSRSTRRCRPVASSMTILPGAIFGAHTEADAR